MMGRDLTNTTRKTRRRETGAVVTQKRLARSSLVHIQIFSLRDILQCHRKKTH